MRTSKFLLLFSLLSGGAWAQELISSDRFILRILDRAVSYQDITFQLRNLQALNCVYEDALVISYFEKDFIRQLDQFIRGFPKKQEETTAYLHRHEELLKKIRYFFKMLRYSEDQNKKISLELSRLIQEGTKANNCRLDVLYKDSLKTNFKALIEMELYLRSRYEGQLKSNRRNFDIIRPSIDLFLDSLDKQFQHEYFW